MKSVNFPQANITIAKDQPKYNPLRAHRAPDGVVTSCWELEAADLVPYGHGYDPKAPIRVYVSQLTFGHALQPLCVQSEFNPPTLAATEPPATLHPVDMPPLRDIPPEAPSIAGQLENKLAKIAHLKGMSGPLLWALDPVSKESEGITVCHFLRLETQHLTAPVDGTKFNTLNPDNDARLTNLAQCFTAIGDTKLASFRQVLPLVAALLEQVEAQAVMRPGTARHVADVRKLVGAACKAL